MSKKCKLNSEQRFQFIDDEQLDAKREEFKNNTVKLNKEADTCFQNYLLQKDFWWNICYLMSPLWTTF